MWYNAGWNTEIIKLIQSINSPFMDKIFEGFTMLGDEYFYIVALTIIYWCIDKKSGYKIGFAFLFGMALNSGIKESLMVPRPIGEPGIRSLRVDTAPGWSFPSGHTQGAATFWSTIIACFKNRLLSMLGVIIIILVGISRLYLGVHRPIDVIAGILIAVIWVMIVNRIFNYIEAGGSSIVIVLFALPALAGLIFFRNAEYYKAAGTFLSFVLGYAVESNYIDFKVKGTFGENVLKFIIGISGVLIIKSGVKLILPEMLLSDLFRYFLVGIWVTIGATSIFKRSFKSQKYIFR